jgi:hypothetical protein
MPGFLFIYATIRKQKKYNKQKPVLLEVKLDLGKIC